MSDPKLSGNENLWYRGFDEGPLDDPEDFSIPEHTYQWTRRYNDNTTKELTLSFENGNLVSVNGNKLPLIEAIALLNNEVGNLVPADLSGSSLLRPITRFQIVGDSGRRHHHGCTLPSPCRYAGDQYARLEATPGTEVGPGSDIRPLRKHVPYHVRRRYGFRLGWRRWKRKL